MGDFNEYEDFDGLGLAELVRKREVKPIELVEEAIRRIELRNPQVNAVIHKAYEFARQQAETTLPSGPFAGIPFLVKDLLAACAGMPMHSGSRLLRGYVPDFDSELVKRFKRAGVVIIGKTNTPEFGASAVTEPQLYGPSHNPWDLTRTTGGSSGGSAAAVASRIVPIAHGNDGGGSIRIPASCCGLFGLKPSRGRNPLGPQYGEVWHGLVAEHVLTRSVRDSAAMLDATAGPDAGAPYFASPPHRPYLKEVTRPPGKLRIAYTAKPFLPGEIHDDCLKGLEATVKVCRDLGHDLVEASPQIMGSDVSIAVVKTVCADVRADILDAEKLVGREATSNDVEPATWMLGTIGQQLSAAELTRSLRFLQQTSRQVGEFLNDFDVLLTPTLSRPPIAIGTHHPRWQDFVGRILLKTFKPGTLLKFRAVLENIASQAFEFAPFTPLFNVTGQPAMSVPLHWNADGLPIGMHFAARYGDEATLFRLAGQLEQALPWFDRAPNFD
ncbi:MAG: amidase [Planctomycetota bacterium]|nr:amidase [Planctomycetota bacterium]MDA1213982.1 amidase [Planctomycetota bacterium]